MREYIKEFLDAEAVEKGAALNTLRAYRNDLNKFITAVCPQKVTDVKSEDIETYIKEITDSGSSPKTVSRKISCIREFFKFLQSEKIVRNNPANKLRTPKIGKNLPSFLTEKEVNRLCAAAKNEKNFSFMRMNVMVKLMYSSGLRVSELVSLPENAINYDLRQILVRGKGSKERIIPVAKEVITDIFKYLEYRDSFVGGRKNNWMFPSLHSASGHITRDGFFKNLKKLAIKAGISPSKVHPHVLRHSFATKLVNNDADIRSIQKMLGHENIVTTEIYTHITTQRLVDEVRMNHPLAQQLTPQKNVNGKNEES